MRAQQDNWTKERARLIEKNELARFRSNEIERFCDNKERSGLDARLTGQIQACERP